MGKIDFDDPEQDPCAVLGVDEDTGEEDIRRAYLEKIKRFPPDRFPEEFEEIRDAYELLRDPGRRMGYFLKSLDPRAPLTRLLETDRGNREFVGPGPWLALMSEKR